MLNKNGIGEFEMQSILELKRDAVGFLKVLLGRIDVNNREQVVSAIKLSVDMAFALDNCFGDVIMADRKQLKDEHEAEITFGGLKLVNETEKEEQVDD